MATMDRRNWLHAVGAASLGIWASPLQRSLGSEWLPSDTSSDSLPMQLYKSLSDQQREKVCLPANHARRKYVSNWWYIHPEHRIPTTFNSDQQELIRKIFDTFHSEDYKDAVNKQVLLDQYGDENNAPAVGFFGTPDNDDFEFLFTGHHVTRRCNAHSAKGLGFCGNPIFYGHYPHPLTDMRDNFNEAKEHPGNPYWYQGKLFNQFVSGLDGKQQKAGLVPTEPRSEHPNAVIRKATDLKGLKSSELSGDQKKLLLETMKGMLAMFRQEDIDATMNTIQKKGIVDTLNISWFSGIYDIGSDQVWDTWQIEGPDLVWYFRGYPHIHCYFHLNA